MDKACEATVKLITHRCSPYSQRVHIALLEKGISYEPIIINFGSKSQLLLDANPIWTKVPVLLHDNKVVAESLIVLEYLEEVWPEQAPLMPKGAHERSQVRFWSDYIQKEFTAFVEYSKLPSDAPEKQAGRDATLKFIRTLDAAMTSYSADGPFFTGDEFGFLDVVLAPLAGALPLVEAGDGLVIPGPDQVPRFLKWLEAVRARPSVSASLPSVGEYLAFLNELATLFSGLKLKST